MGCSREPNEPGTTQLKRILNTFSLSCSPRKTLDVVLVGPLLPAQKITLQKKYGATIIPAKLHWHLAQQEKLRSDLHRVSPNAAFIYDWEDVLYQVSTSEINPYLFPFFRQQSDQTILLTHNTCL